ncbi:MAG: type II secretion system F family protein [Planctomycetaceae bacterium]|nr:type II secretion system F family protein [Planctomycetaceae bacterium]
MWSRFPHTTAEPKKSFDKTVRSLFEDESTNGPIAPAQDSVLRDERDELRPVAAAGPELVASSLEREARPELDIEKQFVVKSSQASQEFTSKQRSWTSRSLFGKPIAGAQVDLPRMTSSDIPFADRSDYKYGNATTSLAAMMPETDERKAIIQKELLNAGHYTPHAYENFAAKRWIWLMAPIAIFGLGFALGPPVLEPVFLLLMVVGAGLGWALPRMFLRSRAAERRREIELALPDVIDLLNMCVSQGMTLRAGLARVAWEISETYPVMSEELRIVAEQADLSTTEHALQNLNERCDVPELHSLSSLLIQTERMGTNVSDSLTEYSDAMRATLQQRADQKANAATFKLLFPTVLCLMPAVYFFLLGPAVVELSEFFKGGGLQQYQIDAEQFRRIDPNATRRSPE